MVRRRALFVAGLIAAAILLFVLIRNRSSSGIDAEDGPDAPSVGARHSRPLTSAERERQSATPIQLNQAGSAQDTSVVAGSFEGKVVSTATGRGVPGAEITFQHASGASSVRSGSDGAFRFAPAQVGTYRLAAVIADGYLPFAPEWGRSPITLAARPRESIRDIVLFLSPAQEYLGVVLNPGGERVAGARVSLLNAGEGEMALAPLPDVFTSDGRGEFRFRAPPGAWLEARHPDYSPGRAEVSLSVLGSRKLEVTLSAKSTVVPDQVLAGRVVDSADAPVAEAAVSAVRRGRESDAPEGRFRPEVKTDADGRFLIDGLTEGIYDLAASHPGFAPARARRVESGNREIVLKLSPGARISGRVRDRATKEPVVAFTVTIQRVRGSLGRTPMSTVAFMDGQGNYEISGVPPGRLAAIAAGYGYAPSQESVFTLADGAEEQTVDFELDRGAELVGTVVDRKLGSPLAGAQVSIEGELSATSVLSLLTSAIADAAGHFELRGLAPGFGSVLFTAEKHHSRLLVGLRFENGKRLGPLKVELEPTGEGEEPRLEMEGIGAVLSASNDSLVIARILDGGGAAQAGLAVGDEILSVDGRPVTELGFNGSIQRIRGPEGSCIPLTVRKADGRLTQTVVCRSRVRGS